MGGLAGRGAAVHVRYLGTGRQTSPTSVPSALALRISNRPPCSSTRSLAIGKPSPAPTRVAGIDLAEGRHSDLFCAHAKTRTANVGAGTAGCELSLDLRRMLGQPVLVAQHRVSERRRVP